MTNQIQWFPGHMHKTRQELQAVLPRIDLILELLDARIPFSSENPMLGTLKGNKPTVKVLMKSDLSDRKHTMVWKSFYARQKTARSIMVSIKEPPSVSAILDECHECYRENHRVRDRWPLTIMVVGIPNVGKSSLINALVGRTITKTGNQPGITRMPQRVRLNQDIWLHDTPGVLWPNVENRHSGFRLAIVGSIRDTAIVHQDVASYAAEYLVKAYPHRLVERYRLEPLPSRGDLLLRQLGRARGCLKRGGQVDMDRAAKLLLTDIRMGSLGGLTFETPEMMSQEVAEVEYIRSEKAARQSARKKRRQQR